MRYLRAVVNDMWAGMSPLQRPAKSALAAHVRFLAQRGEINLDQLTRALEASFVAAKKH
jgi:hypothetical protein